MRVLMVVRDFHLNDNNCWNVNPVMLLQLLLILLELPHVNVANRIVPTRPYMHKQFNDFMYVHCVSNRQIYF